MTSSCIVALLTITFVTLCRATDNVCPEYGSYRVANPRSKSSFYFCNNGYAKLNYCPNGHYFDRQSAKCVAPGGYNNQDYASNRNQRSNYNNGNDVDHHHHYSQSNDRYHGSNQNERYSQQNGYRNNAQQQRNTRSYQQNGYNNAQRPCCQGSQQQNGYRNNARQEQNAQSYQQNGYNRNSQQQNSRYRSSQQQQSSSDLVTDPEVNRQNQDRLLPANNDVPRVICPRVISGNTVLMPNEEDQSQGSYYVCQRSGARRLLRCPEGTKFNVGMKQCMSSAVSTASSGRRQNAAAVDEHW